MSKIKVFIRLKTLIELNEVLQKLEEIQKKNPYVEYIVEVLS